MRRLYLEDVRKREVDARISAINSIIEQALNRGMSLVISDAPKTDLAEIVGSRLSEELFRLTSLGEPEASLIAALVCGAFDSGYQAAGNVERGAWRAGCGPT